VNEDLAAHRVITCSRRERQWRCLGALRVFSAALERGTITRYCRPPCQNL